MLKIEIYWDFDNVWEKKKKKRDMLLHNLVICNKVNSFDIKTVMQNQSL